MVGACVSMQVQTEVAYVAQDKSDGVTIVRISQPPATPAAAVTAAVGKLREAMGPIAHLSVVLPLNRSRVARVDEGYIDRPALAKHVDFVILIATLDPPNVSAVGPRLPEPNVALGALAGAAAESGLATDKVVIALAWFGWDFRCSNAECSSVLPPSGTRATWRGWNLQRSIAYIIGTLTKVSGAKTEVDTETGTAVLRYRDATGINHVVSYDTPVTLAAK